MDGVDRATWTRAFLAFPRLVSVGEYPFQDVNLPLQFVDASCDGLVRQKQACLSF